MVAVDRNTLVDMVMEASKHISGTLDIEKVKSAVDSSVYYNVKVSVSGNMVVVDADTKYYGETVSIKILATAFYVKVASGPFDIDPEDLAHYIVCWEDVNGHEYKLFSPQFYRAKEILTQYFKGEMTKEDCDAEIEFINLKYFDV